MLYFDNDYLEGAHPRIIERLTETNFEQTIGYGFDPYSDAAKTKIKRACNQPNASVFFMVGGTQANASALDALLRPWESVLSASTGHIATHEAGAIESTGHKVIELPHEQGKISAADVRKYLENFFADPTHDHMPFPKMVYISHPSEYGTLYRRQELQDLRTVCDDYQMYLFLDGARLGYGLASPESDIDLPGIAALCDAFTIGGTKVGALFGEALVFSEKMDTSHFFTLMKQRGAVLAKGRLLGIQFDTLFTDGLYFEISQHAIDLAFKLKRSFLEKGYSLFLDSPTNQQFVVLENAKMAALEKTVSFSFWEPYGDNHCVVRFATSWATREEDIDTLLGLL